MSFYFRIVIVVFLFLGTSCSFVQIKSNHDDELDGILEVYPGIIFVNVEPQDGAVVVKTHGLGLVGGHDHVSLGWLKETVVRVPDASECRVVILAHEHEIKRILALLKNTGMDLGTICLTS